jgi:hypothetical protein
VEYVVQEDKSSLFGDIVDKIHCDRRDDQDVAFQSE